MRSGLGPGATLAAFGIAIRRDMPGVGQNLQDHLLSAGNLYRARKSLPPTTTQHSESLTYIHARAQTPEDAPDLVVACVTVPVVSETLAHRIRVPVPGDGYTLMFGITHPRSRGRLTIASADPHAKPIIDPAYLSEPKTGRCSSKHSTGHGVSAERTHMRPGAAKSYCRGPAISRAERRDWRSSSTPPSRITTRSEPAGWERDPDAVVRPDLSIADVPGLHIVDGSISRASPRVRSTQPSSRSPNGRAIFFPHVDHSPGCLTTCPPDGAGQSGGASGYEYGDRPRFLDRLDLS